MHAFTKSIAAASISHVTWTMQKSSCIYIEAGILCSPRSFNFPLHTSIIATFVPTKVPQMKGNKEGPRQKDKKQSLKKENEKKRTNDNDHTMCAIFIYLQTNACIITAHIYTLRNHVEMCHGSIKPARFCLRARSFSPRSRWIHSR